MRFTRDTYVNESFPLDTCPDSGGCSQHTKLFPGDNWPYFGLLPYPLISLRTQQQLGWKQMAALMAARLCCSIAQKGLADFDFRGAFSASISRKASDDGPLG